MIGRPPVLPTRHEHSHENDQPSPALPFAVVAIQGKGFGVIATRDIHFGERILAEEPLTLQVAWMPNPNSIKPEAPLVAEKSIAEHVGALPASQQRQFCSLSQATALYGAEKTLAGIAATNGIPFRSHGQLVGGVFATASRFNHSCSSNMAYKWNEELGKLTVHATRPLIAANTELTFNYGFGSVFCQRGQRQRHLLENFGFTCDCAKCGLQGKDLAASEQRTQRIGDDAAVIRALGTRGSLEALLSNGPAQTLACLEELWALMRAEGGEGLYHGTEVGTQHDHHRLTYTWPYARNPSHHLSHTHNLMMIHSPSTLRLSCKPS